MNSDKKLLYILTISFLGLLLLILAIPYPNCRYGLVLLLVAYVLLFNYFVKKRNILSIYKNQVLLIMAIGGIVYLTLYYLTGLDHGFYRVNNSLLTETLPLLIGIVSFEFIRYILVSQKNKYVDIIAFVSAILIDTILMANIYNIKNFYNFMDLIGLVLLPSIISNVLYHMVAKNYGFYPNIAIRLITTLHTIFIPIIPATPESIIAMLRLVYPLVFIGLLNMLYQKKQKVALKRKPILSSVILGLVLFCSATFGLLISNQFKFGALVIATNSMTGEINKGDLIVFEKIDNFDEIGVGNIIVFKQNDSFIIHRVVGIEKIDNQTVYYTKGDANEDNDPGFITNDDIVGVTKFKLSYFGYPTLWLREFFN